MPNDPSIHVTLARIEQHLADHGRTLDRIDLTVHGRGEKEPGLVLRVDRMERTLGNYAKALWIFATATIGLLVKAVWPTLK